MRADSLLYPQLFINILTFMTMFRKDAYESAMEQALKESEAGAPVKLDNFDRSHATKAIRFMLSRAEKEIVLFCHKLAADVYSNRAMLDALKSALSKGVKMRVFVRDSMPESSLFNDVIALYNVPVVCGLNKFRQTHEIADFCLVDQNLLRREEDAHHRSASLFFGDRDAVAGSLRSLELLERCSS